MKPAMSSLDNRTPLTVSDYILIGLKLSGHVLSVVARTLEWLFKFVLNFTLYFINLSEAVIGVVLQVLRMVKDIVKVMFSIGGIFYHIGSTFGAQGSFLLILCLITYICFWQESNYLMKISDTSFLVIRVVCATLWIIVVPITLLFAVITTKRTLTKLVHKLILENELSQKIQASSIEGYVQPAKRLFVDKSTETSQSPKDTGRRSSPDREEVMEKEGSSEEEYMGRTRSGGGKEKEGRKLGRRKVKI